MEKEIKVIDYKHDQFGDYPFIGSTWRSNRKWTPIQEVDIKLDGQQVLVRARVHNIRAKGNNCFIVLRQNFSTLQAVAFKGEQVTKEMIKYMGNVPNQSIVDLVGRVVKPEKPIESCTQQVELQILQFFVVNRAVSRLPLQISDASRKVLNNEFDPEEEEELNLPKSQKEQTKQIENVKQEVKEKKKKEKQSKQKITEKEEQEAPIVKMKTRLDNRVLDIRTPAKQAIFKLSSGVCQIYREFLLERNFVEIHSPKMIGGSSEGGANVFHFSYFSKKACLAQSPQLYKQMCVMGDFQKVFEIGPVFRAEKSFTHRHMCQFVGLDCEMSIKEHYYELLEFFGELFPYLFDNIEKRLGKQLKAINEQYQFKPFKCKVPVVKLTFEEGIQLLNENGVKWSVHEDLSTEVERQLGDLVKAKYDTDFYMLHRYPETARPFYSMLCKDDPRFTCSYDFFMRGEEILSGAQRIHEPQLLEKRAIEKGIDPVTVRDYIDCFRYGAYPHGGGGIGLERVVMLYCGLKNIRNASLFPRDPKRIAP